MPPSRAGSSPQMLQSYLASLPGWLSPVNAQLSASKQTPPPSRKNTTLVGSARRAQNANSLPSAHSQPPPGETFVQVRFAGAVGPAGVVAALAPSAPPRAVSTAAATAIAHDVATIAI